MSRDFWDLMFNALDQTTDEEWAQFVENFDNEHPEVYEELLYKEYDELNLEGNSKDLMYDFTSAA